MKTLVELSLLILLKVNLSDNLHDNLYLCNLDLTINNNKYLIKNKKILVLDYY